MARAEVEVERLRRARQLFERAQRDGVSMGEARRRIHEERRAAVSAGLVQRAAIDLCGTAAPIAHEAPAERPVMWWQRD